MGVYKRVGRDRTIRELERRHDEVLKRNASRVSKSDATVGLEKKCQSGVHKRSLKGRHGEVLKRNASRVSSDATVGLENKTECSG
jgi:hypothetical protein